MTTPDTPNPPARKEQDAPLAPRVSRLPSGKSIVVSADRDSETIEVRSGSGDMELRIALTDEGPVITLRGAKLNLESTDTVSVNCRRLELNTTEDLQINTGGSMGVQSDDEIRMKSAQQTFIDGDYVNLNCLDRTGYHDEGMEQLENLPPDAADTPQADTATESEDGCCDDTCCDR